MPQHAQPEHLGGRVRVKVKFRVRWIRSGSTRSLSTALQLCRRALDCQGSVLGRAQPEVYHMVVLLLGALKMPKEAKQASRRPG